MCFDMRMDRTALYAHEWGFSHIATTNSYFSVEGRGASGRFGETGGGEVRPDVSRRRLEDGCHDGSEVRDQCF